MGQVRRRQFLIAVGALVGAPLAPSKVAAQTPQKVYRVAHLSTAGRTPDGVSPRALRMSLQRLAYFEGRNVVYEARFAEGNVDRLPALAAELVALKVDVIVAQGRPAVVAAQQATSTIPIVIAPACRISSSPRAPSAPIPVRITPTAFLPA